MITENSTLGKIAISIPGATAILNSYRLDFCCSGEQTLGEAAAKKGLDQEKIISELNELYNKGSSLNWRKLKPSMLIDYIITNFHNLHRCQLPELIKLSKRVEHVHALHPDCPHGLANHLKLIQEELETHMTKEEMVLFPMITNGSYPAGPIYVMQNEHQHHGKLLESLDRLSFQQQLPENACNTWKALYLGITTFREDLMEHIMIENEILFVEPHTSKGNCCGSCS